VRAEQAALRPLKAVDVPLLPLLPHLLLVQRVPLLRRHASLHRVARRR
jgi:hypothetical protein